jgi:hypothetical protein
MACYLERFCQYKAMALFALGARICISLETYSKSFRIYNEPCQYFCGLYPSEQRKDCGCPSNIDELHSAPYHHVRSMQTVDSFTIHAPNEQ